VIGKLKPMNFMGYIVRRCSTCAHVGRHQRNGAPIDWILNDAAECPSYEPRRRYCRKCGIRLRVSESMCKACTRDEQREWNKRTNEIREKRARNRAICEKCGWLSHEE